MTFELTHTDPMSDARAGTITTAHGQIQTPIFMPVGTCGSVKGVHFSELKEQVKAQIILGNTYHLYLRPGLDILKSAGGLHRFGGWDRPILTDSGGFQVFSLTGIRKLREEGCEFRSHIDGSKHIFTPENVMDTERVIGADIMMAFDECPPGQSDYSYAKKSLAMTQRWLDRCIKRFNETEPLYGYEQSLFPIVQGCTYKDLRSEAAKFVADKGADGNAIGGLAVGEPTETMYEMIEVVNGILPKDKPRYLMGVGTPQNILEAIERGVDMFDCVMPTRNGRNAMLFTYNGTMNMRNKKWEKDFSPIDPDGCEVDLVYTKAYLHHLFKAGELLAMQIASIHNLAFYLRLVSDARRHIMQGDFTKWKQGVIDNLGRRV
ncbi:tRNA guanosine(34) transglycosylase Tgt [Marseilla massiliensis]|jgi:queuine tRNA-ribosyltransferase|uniref:Queuine tRNA-ribosyltransferase n=1 Tax=Marseilla massiliensis TaxID=1841864 RepID=A0A938WN22_9BACT|nr:tRNA guanosine(34) transglycosylase Tgt [Marseilla massiliensis]MBM6662002.1 tRNA guanosine(34) transglycosylase Tgt [Marseilla massiliensis]MCL1609623.1 tRNA guanosine(34) transglycosylase Tgt [Marseilla massiliensis]MEE0362195.1 tRNA guanosine(34) transglycosylase Tgt [Prevotella sp.]